MTFTVIAGGMYFLSEKYPWMFGNTSAQPTQTGSQKIAPAAGLALAGGVVSGDSTKGGNETVEMLRRMLAEKNDSLVAKNDSIHALNSVVSQLRQKSSDASSVISQLQGQVDSWKNQRRKDLASAYNDMDPAAAAKIMKNLDDADIIFILSTIQKKQAGQILGDLDPVRAAKLMMSLRSSR